MNTAEPSSASYDRVGDVHGFEVFMQHGGWCWYQDPRAIVAGGKLVIGSVRGNGLGPALIGVYDLAMRRQLGAVAAHPSFDRDDHNSPVFYERPDGRVLAVYARHDRDALHRTRLSDPGDPLTCDDEKQYARWSPHTRDRVTYMNLFYLADEGRLYNFYRGIEFNPTFVTSKDHGDTWSEPTHLFKNEVGGRHRPYARYAGNGKDTVHVGISDAHPRDFGNGIYYFAFRDGCFFRADGTAIRPLEQRGPLRPSEAETVYRGSMTRDKPPGADS